jgi:PPK2 family polyphosphate:nucleotide phosphotransferase
MFTPPTHPLLVPDDGSFRVHRAATHPPKSRTENWWKEELEKETRDLGDWQHKLFADGRFAVLIVFQALDAAGKDGTIRHVFGRINPVGLRVASFKAPTKIELAHDFLWRTTLELPRRGEVAVFSRSHYEEVLVVRVHPELLAAERVPQRPGRKTWHERFRAIVAHERHLAEQGTVILKFWLNISRDEQRDRLIARIDEPDKRWKFQLRDVAEREHWREYMHAYGECLNATSKPWAPWYAIPANNKHYARWQVAVLINAALAKLGLEFPQPSKAELARLKKVRSKLAAE